MAAMRRPRLQVGSGPWIAEERSSALQIVESEVEEFSYSARNEFEWLNEHMAGIFNENETNIAEAFKTPGKLRGKTPRTTRKLQPAEARVPLSDVFGSTPIGSANRFAQNIAKAQSPLIQRGSPSPAKIASPRLQVYSGKPAQSQIATQDSGYHGSQDMDPTDADFMDEDGASIQDMLPPHGALHTSTTVPLRQSPSRTFALESPDKTFRTAKEEQTTRVVAAPDVEMEPIVATQSESDEDDMPPSPSPQRRGPIVAPSSPTKEPTIPETNEAPERTDTHHNESVSDDIRSPSDGSSPIRPMVRKSSLNFPSLPAREPLGAGKSIGARLSRTSHLDHNRTSYYSRPTGGKSLGNYGRRDVSEDEDNDEMEVDTLASASAPANAEAEKIAANYNKTYTQQLQDRISILGKSQPDGGRTSKSIANLAAAQQPAVVATQPAQDLKSPSPKKLETSHTPGAFPEDDDDDWIDPPSVGPPAPVTRPSLPKSHIVEAMEGIQKEDGVAGSSSAQAKAQEGGQSHQEPSMPQRPGIFGHGKSASVSVVPTVASHEARDGSPLKKAISVSNPSLAMATTSARGKSPSPSKSPSRLFRDSPLKQVKNKLSAMFITSKVLIASSAALSAEGKTTILSPSPKRLGAHAGPSSESVVSKLAADPARIEEETSKPERAASPSRPIARRTRASVEREKEEKRREKETKRLADETAKLDKAREKEREKARVFSKEQERVAAMEKQMTSKKENEKPLTKEIQATRSSPRKAKTNQDAETRVIDDDVEMSDSAAMPPPSAPRSVGPPQTARNKEVKRPVKPGKEPQARTKQAPTVIRVNTGSQHSQYHPSSSTMSAVSQASQDYGASTSSQSRLAGKASKPSLQTKPSIQSLKGLGSSTGRTKAVELAAKKKEQDEREAQRRRDVKAEMERKRAAALEEQRKQQEQRRLEAERLRQKEREQAEAKRNARQAAIEQAKQTRAPPPAVRAQPNGPPDYSLAQSLRADGPSNRPPSRLNSGIHRPQEDLGRPVNAVLSNAAKPAAKRPLGQEGGGEGQARRPPSRGGPSYQAKDAKRRRTSDDFGDELEFDNLPNIKGPPVRPSAGIKKDLQAKPMYAPPQSATRDLFRVAVAAQHTGVHKAAHPLDMAQISKGAIPFAPNPNQAGPAYKTPARPGAMTGAKSAAKSAQRSSPQMVNGDSIELPEIETDDDDEDEEEDAHGTGVAAWADSPDLRRALMRQETMDPSQIFGPPAPLNMEEVFSKSKDKWPKFRARTSSANWSGADRLTEDDIRKDLAARDKMRREGGWSYEMSKDMI